MAKKKTYKVKPLSPERALQNYETYQHNREIGKESKSRTVEKSYGELSKFLTKKGTPKKSALRNQKQIKEYNKLVRKLTTGTYATFTKRERIRKKATATAIEKGTYKKSKSKRVRKAFALDIYHILLDEGFFSSDQMINIAQDFKIDDKILEDILTKMYDRYTFDTPEDAKHYIDKDDFYTHVDSILNLMTKKGMSFEDAYNATL